MTRPVQVTLICLLVVFTKVAAEDGVCNFWAVGDSITRGNILDGDARSSWVEEFDELTRSDYSLEYAGSFGTLYGDDQEGSAIRTEGHWGWTSEEVLNGRESAPAEGKLESWLKRAEKVNIVTIHLGTNDLARSKPENIVENIKKIISIIREAHPHVKFFVAKIIRANLNDDWDARRLVLNKLIGEMANSSKGVHVVDLENVVASNDLPDNVHPNGKGARAMAKAFYKSVKESAALDICKKSPNNLSDDAGKAAQTHVDGGLTVVVAKEGDTGLGGRTPHIDLFARPKHDSIVIFAMRCFVALCFFYILFSGDNFFVLRWTNWRNGAQVPPWVEVYAEKVVATAPAPEQVTPKAT